MPGSATDGVPLDALITRMLARSPFDYRVAAGDAEREIAYRLQTIDVQSSTLHSTPGYDAETGVGTPHGPAFFGAGD